MNNQDEIIRAKQFAKAWDKPYTVVSVTHNFIVMTEWVKKMLESKRQIRNRLSGASFSEKVKVLEK